MCWPGHTGTGPHRHRSTTNPNNMLLCRSIQQLRITSAVMGVFCFILAAKVCVFTIHFLSGPTNTTTSTTSTTITKTTTTMSITPRGTGQDYQDYEGYHSLLLEFQQLGPETIILLHHHLLSLQTTDRSSPSFPLLSRLLSQSKSRLSRSSKAQVMSKLINAEDQQIPSLSLLSQPSKTFTNTVPSSPSSPSPQNEPSSVSSVSSALQPPTSPTLRPTLLPASVRATLNVWDIPRTIVYDDWQNPPGYYGSELYQNKRLGITKHAKHEAQQVVKYAFQQLVDIDASSLPRVIRFDRRIEKDRGVRYNVLFQAKDGNKNDGDKKAKQVTSISISQPFQPLQIDSVEIIDAMMIYIVVAVSNRTPQLIKMMKSLEQMSHEITLIVIDHSSTDGNIKKIVEHPKNTFQTYFLYAPRNIVKFSRALMLDHGIRYVYNELDPSGIFFTIDVDMVVPATLPAMVTSSVQKGRAMYAPIVRVMNEDGTSKYFDWGYGMIGAYVCDYVAVGGYDTKKFKYGWGGEDVNLVTTFLRQKYSIIRSEEYSLVHKWHPALEWRNENTKKTTGKSMCKFSWTKGEYCASVDDENDAKHRLNAGRSWSIKLRTNQYCSNAMKSNEMIAATHEEGEDRNDNALWKKKAYDLDLPNENGKYLIAMAYSTGGWFISELNQEVPPSIQMCIATTTATFATSETSDTVEKGQTKTLTSTTHVLKTIENTGHGIVIEIKKNKGKDAHRLIRTTLWLWHTALLKDTSDCSSNKNGETSIVVTELMNQVQQRRIMYINSASQCSPAPQLTYHTHTDSSYSFGATALDKSAVPIYLPKGTYTIIAKSGGFDAGDGKVYFKAELRFVVLDKAHSKNIGAKLFHVTHLHQRLTLVVKGTNGGYLHGLVRDQTCEDNKGTLVVQVENKIKYKSSVSSKTKTKSSSGVESGVERESGVGKEKSAQHGTKRKKTTKDKRKQRNQIKEILLRAASETNEGDQGDQEKLVYHEDDRNRNEDLEEPVPRKHHDFVDIS